MAYLAQLIIHRYALLGVLDERGYPLRDMGILESPAAATDRPGQLTAMAGARCPECGNASLIHKDGCEFCTSCGFVGQCG